MAVSDLRSSALVDVGDDGEHRGLVLAARATLRERVHST
jgi:hypothetical protein